MRRENRRRWWRRHAHTLATGVTLALACSAQAGAPFDISSRPGIGQTRAGSKEPAARILAAIPDESLRAIIGEALARNPDLAAIQARARAAGQRAPQVGSLPDPMAAITAFLRTPETRVGPQKLTVSLSQRFPWFGKLELLEQAALLAAAGAEAQVEERRLALVTELRRLYYDLAFLDLHAGVIRADRATLDRYEELARTRYASGTGLEQAVIKIQAEITRDESRLLEIATRRATALATLNALRDTPPGTPIGPARLPAARPPGLDLQTLREVALANRPEVGRSDAGIAEAAKRVALARKEYRPDLNLGLTYTLVGGRDDPAGIATPPPDNARDILGLQLGINLPIRRRRLEAGVAEAVEGKVAAEATKRSVVAAIDGALGELVERVRLTAEQLRLLEDVLDIQAEHSLVSAEAGYATGTVGALDLLDAERVLLDIRTLTARTRADLAIAVARLEGAIGTPLASLPSPRGAF